MALFAMMGICLISLPFSFPALLCVLLALFFSVAPFMFWASKAYGFPEESLAILVWGGLRGGLSLAMALSPTRDILVIGAWVVAVFSLTVQASAIPFLVKKLFGAPKNL